MKIYTKTGDKGETSLIGGTRVPKHHLRIETYGTVDELNSWIGLVRDMMDEENIRERLKYIQDRLFTAGSNLAADKEHVKMILPDLTEADIQMLEKDIDEMDHQMEPLKNFVIPGGHLAVSYSHVARCVCRRAERLCVHLAETEHVPEIIIIYLNRLSDYLFTLARFTAHLKNIPENIWNPSGR